MTGRVPRRRGQPLLVLTAVMLCWIGVRAFIWRVDDGVAAVVPRGAAVAEVLSPPASLQTSELPVRPASGQVVWAAGAGPARARPKVGGAVLDHLVAALLSPPPNLAGGRKVAPPVAAGSMLRMAPMPAAEGAPSFLSPFAAPPAPRAARAERRWSADAWTLLRSGGGAASAGPSVATYGASQAGAVLRYRLWPGNPHRPTGYVRVSAALNGSGEREAALGLSVRPIGALPVFVAGEGRVSQLAGRTVVRPAVVAVTELPPIALPVDERGRVRAEFYLQGGYVGGLGATPFIDGQLRIDRHITRLGPVEVRAGGGAWGGAQRGAGRLDLGPAVTLQAARGPAAMRLGFDWRFRLMGEAEPASGPALTISAGF